MGLMKAWFAADRRRCGDRRGIPLLRCRAHGVTIRLTSVKSGVTSVPRLIVVPEGRRTASFQINTLPPTATTICRIMATYLAITRAGYVTVNP